MKWDEMCDGKLTSGISVTMNDLCGLSADANRLTLAALPDADTLTRMITKAQGLKIGETNKGIYFHIVTCAIKKKVMYTAQLFDNAVIGKQGSSVCYEYKVLPLDTDAGVNILVHQGVAPCKRCRTGYKNWAQLKACTIVVATDLKYDDVPPDTVFVFAPSGDVFYV